MHELYFIFAFYIIRFRYLLFVMNLFYWSKMLNYEYPSLRQSKTRAIPITTASQNLFMLEQAKMSVQNEYLNEHSIMAKRKDRYNAHLTDVIDQERINKNVDVACNRQKKIITKQENKSNNADHDIALYNLRGMTDLNNQKLIGNVLPERLRAMNDNKITTPKAWMKDYDYIKNAESDAGVPERFLNNENEKEKFSDFGYGFDTTEPNYNGYLSMLMPSETNIPKPFANESYTTEQEQPNAAMFPDDRLQRNLQTQQRQIKSEGEKVIDAINLKNSDYIKERNARQIEMENMMNHRGQMKLPMIKTLDYVDMLDEQNNGITSPYYELDERFKADNDRFNDRNSGGNKHVINKGYEKSEQIGNINRQQNIYNDIDNKDAESFNKKPLYVYDQHIDPKIQKQRDDRYKQINNTDYDYVIDNKLDDEERTKQAIVQEDMQKTLYIRDKEKFNDRGIEDIDNTKQNINHIENSKYPTIKQDYGKGYIGKEAFNQADHIIIQRRGKVKDVYTNPNAEEVAPVLVTVDKNNKPVRVCATANNNSIYVIQKRDPSFLDIENGTFYKDDYTVLKIPIEQVKDSIKRRIEQQERANKKGFNPTNNRRANKVINMEYKDLVYLANTLDNNIDKCKRVKADSMASYLKDKEFDKKIVFGVEDDKIFSTAFAINTINKYERMKAEENNNAINKTKSFYDKLKNGIKDKNIYTSVNVNNSNINERTKTITDKERYDKDVVENFQDIRPIHERTDFNTWQKQGALGRQNDYHNDINYRNNQISHYYRFEEE